MYFHLGINSRPLNGLISPMAGSAGLSQVILICTINRCFFSPLLCSCIFPCNEILTDSQKTVVWRAGPLRAGISSELCPSSLSLCIQLPLRPSSGCHHWSSIPSECLPPVPACLVPALLSHSSFSCFLQSSQEPYDSKWSLLPHWPVPSHFLGLCASLY